MKEVKLPSGAILKLLHTPFATSKALYQALLEEAKNVKMEAKTEMGSIIKDLLCSSFSSVKVEKCLWACLERCTYNDLKIVESTFEPDEAREDYSIVCMEVAKENVLPFTKGLYAEFERLLALIASSPK